MTKAHRRWKWQSAGATALFVACWAAVIACGGPDAAASAPARSIDALPRMPAPQRVVSMNLCTDQLAMLIADPAQLHSVSYISHDPATSLLAAEARQYKPNHGLAEEIFLMQPDLILAGAFTRRATTQMLARLGFRIETFYPAQSIADIRNNITRMGTLLARQDRSAALLARFDDDLRATKASSIPGPRQVAALYYANNYTSGNGTLAADIVAHAGLENLATSRCLSGMVKLPLELLVVAAPDIIIAEPSLPGDPARAYQAFRHPALRATAAAATPIATGKNWSCGGPFTIEAMRSLQKAARTAAERRATQRPEQAE